MKTLFHCIAAFLVAGSALQAASPDLQNSNPRGGQRGTEVEVQFTGSRLWDITEVRFHDKGIIAKDVVADEKGGKTVKATLVIAPDCRVGEHHVRLFGKSGFSYARLFYVSQFQEIKEVEPNDEFEAPQVIPMNTTVNGTAKPEEVDYYKVTAKKGERISVEMEALRINNVRNQVAIDPYVAILDKDRFELAISDDSAFLKQESVASIVAPEDGEYVIEVRDASYQGRGYYRAHISNTPRPLGVYPAGGQAGSDVEFTYLGDPKGAFKHKSKLPAEMGETKVFGSQDGQTPASGNPVRVSPYGNVLEQEPNQVWTEVKEQAAPSLPIAFNGVLEKDGDHDYFRFTAKKNERFRFRSYANRLGTPVDTVINIYDAKMKSIGGNDDADGSKDSRYDFKAPADGEYHLRVKDMLDQGGENYVYRIETEPFEPRITVTMPEMIRRDMQYRKQFNIPQGGYYAMNVSVKRENLSGELAFDIPKLPKGVTWEAGTIAKSQSQFPILLKAAADAPIGGDIYDLQVKALEENYAGTTGTYQQTVHFVRGNPNGASYYAADVDGLPIAVVEKAPFRMTIDQPKVPIVRDGTMKLKVRLHRDEGFDKKVVARMLWRPPGISGPSTMTFSEKATELDYELNCNAAAELAEWNFCLLAETDLGRGQIQSATPFIKLKVEEPFAKMKINMSSIKRGDAGELICDIEHLRDFPGEADIQVFGLPAKSTTSVQKASKDTAQIRFPIQTAADTPIGQAKNIFCTLVFMQNGEPIQQRLGMGGVVRVDPQPKAPAKPAPKPAAKPTEVAKAEPKPKPAKPLSRLEQLRLEAKKQAAGAN